MTKAVRMQTDGPRQKPILSAARDGMRSFFDWWSSELRSLVPIAVELRLAGWKKRVFLRIGDDQAELISCKDGKSTGGQTLPVDEMVNKTSSTKSWVLQFRRKHGLKRRTVLVLGASLVGKRRTTIPAMPQGDIEKLVRNQVPAWTSFSPDDLFYRYSVRRSSADRQLEISLTYARREDIEAAERLAQSIGLRPTCVTTDEADCGRMYQTTLRRTSNRSGRRAGAWATRVLCACFLGLLVAAIYVPLERKREHADLVTAKAKKLRKKSRQIHQLESRLKRQQTVGLSVLRAKRNSADVALLLARLSAVIPSDTWLFQFRLQGREVRLAGFSTNSAALLDVLSRQVFLSSVRFAGPITVDPVARKERFHLLLRLGAGRSGR